MPAAYAQQPADATAQPAVDAAAADTAEADDTIIVTGSRISRPDLQSSSPVSVISVADMKANNVVTVEQILGANPQFVGNTTGASNNPGDGAATVDLRGLGTRRTLVLIDGKRAPYYDTLGKVDVSAIPVALLQRVEVLTGGASAVYGSDAISGVVNFILNDRFTGLQVDAGTSLTKYKDGATYNIALTGGVKLGDRGNLVLSAGYTKRRGVKFAARPNNRTTLDPTDLSPTGSSNADPTIFDLADGSQVQVTPGGGLTSDLSLYDYTPVNYAQLPLERYNILGLVRYEVTDDVEFYGRGTYSQVTATRTLAPTATAGFTFNISPDNPFLNAAQRAAFFGPGATINDGSGVGADPTARAGTSAIGIRRRITEIPGRINPYKNDSFQFVGGFRGTLADNFKWDVSAQYSQVIRNIQLQGDLSYSALQQALDVVAGPGGTPQCFNPANGCVPLNLFAARTLTAQELAFVLRDGAQRDKTTQFVAQASISGDLGFLKSPWADGPAAISIGAEYRRETGRTTVDANYGSGDLIYYGQGQNIAGNFNVKEAYAELKLPIVQNKPFAYSLGLEAGYRYSDYSTAGSVSSYKIGGDYAPVEGVRFRGIYQRAVRAPNLYELFSPVVAATGSLQTDPCAGAAVADAVRAVCVAQGANPALFAANGNGTFTSGISQPIAGQINIFTGGNSNLDVEKSDTYTFGVVINPVALRRLSIAVDYYSIKIANAIDYLPAAVTVNQCYNVDRNAGSAACSGIVRNPNGTLSGNIQYGVPQIYGNQTVLKTRGLDVTVNYNGGDREGFNYAVSLAGSYAFSYKKQGDPTARTYECAGRFGVACDLEPISKWKHVAEAKLGWKEFSLLTRWRYLGAVRADDGTTVLVSRIPGISYFDFSAGVDVTEDFTLRAGMQNAFDKKSPIVGDAINQYGAGNTFPNTYDVMGRTFFVNATAKF